MPELPTPFASRPTIPVCVCVPQQPEPICITFPVVGEICSSPTNATKYNGLDTIVFKILGNLQPLLTPLMPVLIVISLVKTLVECTQALPKAITSLDPEPILECIDKLLEIFPQLLDYIPPLNYVALVQSVIGLMINLIQMLIDLLTAAASINLDLELELLPDNDNYRCCLTNNINARLDAIAKALRGSGPLFSVMAELIKLLALPGTEKYVQPLVDAAEFLSGASLSADTELQPVIDSLIAVRKILVALHSVLGGVLGTVQSILDCEC